MKKRIIGIGAMISLIIIYSMSIYATEYGGIQTDEKKQFITPQAPIQNPHAYGVDNKSKSEIKIGSYRNTSSEEQKWLKRSEQITKIPSFPVTPQS